MKKILDSELLELLQRIYGLADPVLSRPVSGIESSTYIIATKKRKYVAKLYDDVPSAKIIAQFQDRLSISHLPVPYILRTSSGELTTQIDDGVMVISTFSYGEPIGWSKEFASLPSHLNTSLALVVAKMHLLSLDIDTKTKPSHRLSVERITGLQSYDSTKWPFLDKLQYVRKGMIHGDLARENIFISKSRKSVEAIIDFGDAHYDYITFDLAILLTQIYVTKSWGIDFDGIREFLAQYTQMNLLSERERETILPLMKLRNKSLLQEIEQKLRKENADVMTLDSIKRSLEFKLELLNEHGNRLNNIILSS